MSVDLGRESLDTPSTPKAGSNNASVTPQRQTPGGPVVHDADTRARLDRVLQSDIGINTLLTRLKQSISSAREVSAFLRERASLEEKHAFGIQRLTKSTHDVLGRPENRQGSFAFNYREIGIIHERMAKNSEDFANNLVGMAEELQELAAHCERGRKQWKHVGLEAEHKAQEADSAMDKAKQRYFSLADQYDRVRTGERQGGKFGLKGPKSVAQQEESLLSKADGADQEYRSKVEAAQAQRQELLTTSRPQAIRELQNFVMECDAAVSMQLQKFAVLNEKLLLGNGLCINPLKAQDGATASNSRSLRDVAQGINNQRDFDDFVLSHSSKVGPVPGEIKYEKHPALAPAQHPPPPASNNFSMPPPGRTDTGFTSMSGPINQSGQTSGVVSNLPPQQHPYSGPPVPAQSNAPQLPQIGALAVGGRSSLEGGRPGAPQGRTDPNYRNFSGPPSHRPGQSSYSGPPQDHQNTTFNQQVTNGSGSMGTGMGRGQAQSMTGPGRGPIAVHDGVGRGQIPGMVAPPQAAPPAQGPYAPDSRGPPPAPHNDFRPDANVPPAMVYPAQHADSRGLPSQSNNFAPPSQNLAKSGNAGVVTSPMGAGQRGFNGRPNLPPLRPVFGVPLDELFRRDGAAVPAIVYQCIQAVDLFGLNTEGVYRISGNAQHIMELQALFDHDSSQVDFRSPTSFYNDIASVTTLLKHFLRDLPDPLLTSAQYNAFIQAAKIDEDIVRRDSLHAIINSLPDPNYATLRTLTLHLHRVALNSMQNRMTASNLAIVFGPTLMGGHSGGPGGEIQDAGWQARVVETILNNTLQIFDDDEE